MMINGRNFDFKNQSYVMGVLNVTEDSFYDGGRYFSKNSAVDHAKKLIEEGADFLDIGGESTKPGAGEVSAEEEIKRVVPVIESVRKESDIPISIDTTKVSVAKEAFSAGASIVNDISGLRFDPDMKFFAAEKKCPVIIMHMKGTPKTMQVNPHYDNVINEIEIFFNEQIKDAVNSGLSKDMIILDPGIGFGKRLEDNITILNKLDVFLKFKCPILIGTSRKSFIGMILQNKNPSDRLYGSLGTAALSVLKGASILRVHDVRPTREMITVIKYIMNSRN